MKINSQGALAQYLGFCLGEKYHRPQDFCSLFWLLVFSPILCVIAIIFRIPARYFGETSIYLVNSVDNYFINQQISEYKRNPNLLLEDYYDHYYPCSLSRKHPPRSKWVVRLAISKMKNQNQSIENFICEYCNKSQDDIFYYSRNRMIADYQKSKKAPYVIEEYPLTCFMLLFGLLTLPLGWLAFNLYAFFMCLGLILTLSIEIADKTKIFMFLKTYYRSFKERSCPIITWEYDS